MKYPKAGDLQRELGVELTDNPAQRNPWEVTSDSGLEGVFADEDDAKFHADELRRSGAQGVAVGRRRRQLPRPAHSPAHAEHNPGPRVLREKWGDSSEIVVEHHRYGISGWLESKRGGGRSPISFGATKPETLREAIELAKKFLRGVHGKHNPPFVLPVPGQRIRSWDHGEGQLVRICEEGNDGRYTAYVRLDNGNKVTVPLLRTEYDLEPRKVLERRTGFSRHEEFVGAPKPERMPKGTPMEYDDETGTFVEMRRHSLGRRNPDDLTDKGERMYEHIREGYGDDPRAKEIAARTVAARAKEIPGLKKRRK